MNVKERTNMGHTHPLLLQAPTGIKQSIQGEKNKCLFIGFLKKNIS